ncbi:MAG: VTT domain-containing protein [Pirellulaceae bacterium]|nr:TVP38/TMEM64 family protein [Planctomycetales bacterium]MCA9202533.1 TVP38/TMEM64 family protein [Planctomycetales bacterium]
MNRFWRWRRLILGAAIALFAVGAWWQYGSQVSVQQLADHEQDVRAWVTDHGYLAFLIGLAIFTVASLAPGTPGKTFVYGWLFGFWQGVVLVNAASTIAAMISFGASRCLFRDAVQSRMGFFLDRVNRALERHGSQYLLTMRLMFAPYTLMNYTLGATNVRTRTFCWTTQLGMLPGNLVFVYAASRLPGLQEIMDRGPASLISTDLIVALVLLSVLPIALRQYGGRIWARWNRSNDLRTDDVGQLGVGTPPPGIGLSGECHAE